MPTELEFKGKVSSHSQIRTRLRRLGAQFVDRVLETNIHFDTPKQALLRAGSGLRIRSVRGLGRDKSRKFPSTITFKGPIRNGPYKSREEIETTIGSNEKILSMLEPLGLDERIRFEKRRETWLLRAGRKGQVCKVELDEIPILGTFVEIEAPNLKSLRTAIKLVGLERARSIREAYVGLLAGTRRGRAKSRKMVFTFL